MPDARPLRAGDPVRLGAYEILGLLGEGGQGAVFLGRRAGDGPDAEYVAVKLLHAGLTADSPARARFVRELDVAKRVARFCTAQVLDAEVEGDQPYIVSEYVEGPSLHASVRQQGPRTGGALERLAMGTLTALTAIHQAGIMHRDFKPHNIVLGSDGPRVIDFGIARALDTASDTQTIGTPAYMAPEQFGSKGFGPPADMFAWGSTMVYAATGRPAFGNDDTAAVMHRIVYEAPDLGDLPSPLREVVAACLAKDPEQRPAARDAQQMLLGSGDLATGASGLAELASPASFGVPPDAFTGTPHSPAGPVVPPAPAVHVPPATEPQPNAPQPNAPQPHAPQPQTPRPQVPQPPYGVAAAAQGPAPQAQSPAGPYGPAGPHATRPNPGGDSSGSRRPLLVAVVGVIVAVVLAGGTAWAVTRGGDGARSQRGDAQAAGSPSAPASGGPGQAPGNGGRATGARKSDPASPTTAPSGGKSNPAHPQRPSGQPSQPGRTGQPTPQPTSSGGGGGGGSSNKTNPYTPQAVCNSGGHGSGYYVQRSSAFTGGKVYQLYNSSGYNCVVTLKTAGVGQKTSVWAQVTREDGTKASDSGSYSYYAGPAFIYAKGQCVKYAGGTAQGSASAPWGNCG
jgi:serine/threonine protein kinase